MPPTPVQEVDFKLEAQRTAQAAREQGNFDASEFYLKEASKERVALGLKLGLKERVEVLRLYLERGRARLVAPEQWQEWQETVSTVHDKLQTLAGKSADAPAEQRVALAMLSTTAAWDRVAVVEEAADAESAGPSHGLNTLSCAASKLVDQACDTMREAVAAAGQAQASGQMTAARMAAVRLKFADCCDRAAKRKPGNAQQFTATSIEQVWPVWLSGCGGRLGRLEGCFVRWFQGKGW